MAPTGGSGAAEAPQNCEYSGTIERRIVAVAMHRVRLTINQENLISMSYLSIGLDDIGHYSTYPAGSHVITQNLRPYTSKSVFALLGL
jgi:hypothetical protein